MGAGVGQQAYRITKVSRTITRNGRQYTFFTEGFPWYVRLWSDLRHILFDIETRIYKRRLKHGRR